MPPRTLPQPTPETQHFWDGCQVHELRLQRCRACRHSYFPPGPCCPVCTSRDVEVYVASGRGTLETYVINQRPRPDMGDAPHSIAIVTLAEGPRIMTNIVGCPQTPAALRLDMELQVVFDRQDGRITLPQFAPVVGGT